MVGFDVLFFVVFLFVVVRDIRHFIEIYFLLQSCSAQTTSTTLDALSCPFPYTLK